MWCAVSVGRQSPFLLRPKNMILNGMQSNTLNYSQGSMSFIFDWLPHLTPFSIFLFFSLCTVHVPADLRQSLHPPLSGAKHLDFTMSLLTNRDFLLWISPHAGTVCSEYRNRKNFTSKVMFLFSLLSYENYTPQCMLLSGLNYMCLIVRA